METEVMIPVPAAEFNFDSSCTSPYITAPSSPQRFGNFFYSTQSSPTRLPSHCEFDGVGGPNACAAANGGSLSLIPFDWEEKPGIPKAKACSNVDAIADDDGADFAFDSSGQWERTSLCAADELFDGGKIKPLKPPPGGCNTGENCRITDSPRSPRSPRITFKEVISPRQKKKFLDPFAVAIERTRREDYSTHSEDERGRRRNCNPTSSSVRHKITRSLSPFRASDLLFDQEKSKQSSSSNTWYRKWKLKDLLLFRSTSEGRATSNKDRLNKYALLKKSHLDDVKNSSFRSTDSVGSASSSLRRRRGPVSAHELHYTVNRAVSEEMRKKTFLPYKQGLLGCLGFYPTAPVHHEMSMSLGSFNRS